MPKIRKNCDCCGKEFEQYEKKNYKPKCCSRKCANEMKKGKPSHKKGIKTGKSKDAGLPREYRWKYNKYKKMCNHYIGYDSNNNEFYFDIEDYHKVKDFCWRVKSNGYVVAYTKGTQQKRKHILLHRLIMNFPKEIIDHLDRNPKNNMKNNLELSTFSKNNMNKALTKSNTSGYTGVNYIKRLDKWSSTIKKDYKSIWLGYYDKKEDAIKARQKAELKYFGKIIKRE